MQPDLAQAGLTASKSTASCRAITLPLTALVPQASMAQPAAPSSSVKLPMWPQKTRGVAHSASLYNVNWPGRAHFERPERCEVLEHPGEHHLACSAECVFPVCASAVLELGLGQTGVAVQVTNWHLCISCTGAGAGRDLSGSRPECQTPPQGVPAPALIGLCAHL